MNKLIRIVALLPLLAVGIAQAQNLVTNGSLDTPATKAAYLSSATLPGWTPGRQDGWHGQYSRVYPSAADAAPGELWVAEASPDGGSFLGVDGDLDFNTSISQNVTGLVVGQTYTLSFYQAGAQFVTRTGPTTEWWEVTFAGTQKSSPVLSNVSKGFTGWQAVTMSFVANSTSSTLTFLGRGNPAGAPPVALLDGISLTAPVPEPTTLACMLAGLIGLGGLRLRALRQQRQ